MCVTQCTCCTHTCLLQMLRWEKMLFCMKHISLSFRCECVHSEVQARTALYQNRNVSRVFRSSGLHHSEILRCLYLWLHAQCCTTLVDCFSVQIHPNKLDLFKSDSSFNSTPSIIPKCLPLDKRFLATDSVNSNRGPQYTGFQHYTANPITERWILPKCADRKLGLRSKLVYVTRNVS